MVERVQELRRQLAYIDRELKRGEHEHDGREPMFRQQRRRILEQLTAASGSRTPRDPA